jgi:hypothetical protein
VAKLLGGMLQAARLLFGRENRPAFRDKDTPAGAALEHAIPDEFLISARDGIRIDDQDFRQSAHGWQLLPDSQEACGDIAMNLLDDLSKDGDIAGRRDGETQCHGCTGTLVRRGEQEVFLGTA